MRNAVVDGVLTVNLTLSAPTGGAWLGSPATAVLNIVDDDLGGMFRFGAASYSVTEGGLATITVLRAGGAAGDVTVNFTTADATATAGTDYTATAGTLSFGAGEMSKTFTVQTFANAAGERDRTLGLTLSGPSGGSAVPATSATARLTILAATPSLEFSAPAYPVSEALGGATVTVVRSGPTTGMLSESFSNC